MKNGTNGTNMVTPPPLATPQAADAGVLLDRCIGIIDTDVGRIKALVDQTSRVLTREEAGTISGYVRALVDVTKTRRDKGEDLDKMDLEKLAEEAAGIPELADLLAKAQRKQANGTDGVDSDD